LFNAFGYFRFCGVKIVDKEVIKRMSEKKISKNDVGISGEFYIAHMLAKHGFKVNVSLGRTEGFDFFVK